MGNGTARTFVLSGGAGASLVGAVVVVLVVLVALLAFNGANRSADGGDERSIAIEGAPEAAAQSIAPAIEAVAATPAPVPVAAPASPPTTLAAVTPDLPPTILPEPIPLPPPDRDRRTDEPVPPIDPCLLSAVLPECVEPPDPPRPGGIITDTSGNLDSTTKSMLGLDLGLGQLTAPIGEGLDETVSELYGDIQPPLNNLVGALVGGRR